MGIDFEIVDIDTSVHWYFSMSGYLFLGFPWGTKHNMDF